jgi:hypothetical protein
MRNAYKIFVEKPEGERPLGGPRRRCEDVLESILKEIGWKSACWIHPAQDADQWWFLLNKPLNLQVL